MEEVKNQECPFCHKKNLTLIEDIKDIPHFGKCYLMSMNCSNCKYHKSDVESEEKKEPCKITFTIKDKKDLKVTVVKSSEADIKIPQMRMKVESGPSSIGYITTIEGVLRRFKKIIEDDKDNAEDKDIKKKAKNLLKKLWKVECGEQELKIVIEDSSGNSAIISDKVEISKLK
ncbi:MAG: ZPR1 zinc finger domain-containing protein [Nanoarchaeota archaeon]|nr:ZPR1 zinc finger domain-containing protein [Nanoarchaeota archaeon]